MKMTMTHPPCAIAEATVELVGRSEQLFVKAGSGYIQIFIDAQTGCLYYRVHGKAVASKSSPKSNAYIKERFEEK